MRSTIFATVLASTEAVLSWDDASSQANQLLAKLTNQHKYELMAGAGWHQLAQAAGMGGSMGPGVYVGYTKGIEEMGIPSVNQADAANGFRTQFPEHYGTSTSWPCLLSFAATFDPPMVREFTEAMSEEFIAKGSNMLLGPSINVHRSAKGGRNFEYLSGEDPYLGAKLAKSFVEGASSKKVMTSMKHFIFNQQETNRNTVNSVVDDRTAWELYYPPFQAAVDAGATAAMCSYNVVDGEHACSNAKQLKILKEDMGFRGFVQSDWGAAHGVTVAQGLDQEMPGLMRVADYFFGYFEPGSLGNLTHTLIDNSVRRILAAMYKVGVFELPTCKIYNLSETCAEWINKNVTSSAHNQLAHKFASEAVVLLKNDHAALPITASEVNTIAIVGYAAGQEPKTYQDPDYYSAGGSGHVNGPYVVKASDGITHRAQQLGIKVISSLSNDVDAALDAASKADITIVVGGTTSREGADRPNLTLDGVDDLIAAVGGSNQLHNKKTVVLAQIPGAIVMPWAGSVDAILTLFLAGQETGNAWASVIFGDHAPTGRLPIMMPVDEEDIIQPSTGADAVYSEGLLTSYRNPNFKSTFPFGHGLTYTTFIYGAMTYSECNGHLCISTTVRNTGKVAGKAVPQLYVDFPAEANYPAPLLKGFQKTSLLDPGSSQAVTFELTDQDLSYYTAGKWVKVSNFNALLGVSSRSIVQTRAIQMKPAYSFV